MPNRILYHDDARDKLKVGVDALANAVKVTMGPMGRNVVVERPYGSPMVTKDGVSVAESIELDDRMENLGAKLVKEVAAKTNSETGDGTTTATLLAQTIFNEGLAAVKSGVSAVAIKKGIDKLSERVVKHIAELAEPVSGKRAEQVAQISANDKELGTIIYNALQKVGENGVVTVEEGATFGIETEVVDGMRFDKGYVSPYLVTNAEKMEAEFLDAPVVITDRKLGRAEDLVPMADAANAAGHKRLLVIAEDIEGEALSTAVVNKLRGGFHLLAVKAPGFGEQRKEMLKDLAAVTGATLVSEDTGMKFSDITVEIFGSVRRVVATKEHTTIVGKDRDSKAVSDRVALIKKELETVDSDFDKERLTKRLGALTGGVGIIRVGAATETETKEVKQRVEDALEATKAATEEGVVPGGGAALVHIADKIGVEGFGELSEGEREGARILHASLYMPLKQIAENAGVKDTQAVVDKVSAKGGNFGYNAATDKYEDLAKAGVIDPAKVTRLALQHASSIASLLLTTEVAITDLLDKSKTANPTV